MSRLKNKQRWEKLIEQFLASGLSGTEFCRQNNIKLASFYSWKKKLAKHEKPSDFAQLKVVRDVKVEIAFPNGAVLQMPFGDERALRQVVSMLMERVEIDS